MATIEKVVVELEAGTDLAKAMADISGQLEAHNNQLDDAERCIKGIAEELSKTNARMDALVADREKHQKRLDDMHVELIKATQEAETAFLARIDRAEKRADAYAKINANQKRDAQKGTD